MIVLATKRGMQTQITDDKFEYDSLEDLREQRGDRVMELDLTFSLKGLTSESVQVKIRGAEVTLATSQDDPYLALCSQFQRVVEPRMSALAWLARPGRWFAAGVVIIWSWLVLQAAKSPIAELLAYIGVGFIAICICAQLYVWSRRGAVLKKEHEVQSFWQKHGEKLAYIVLGALLETMLRASFDRLIR
ncbi:MAG: hypothetical protein ACYC9Z_18615 [Casimicrobiaceae bacterium]